MTGPEAQRGRPLPGRVRPAALKKVEMIINQSGRWVTGGRLAGGSTALI
jgi:hypothetical protein